jgi:hypothetical protein
MLFDLFNISQENFRPDKRASIKSKRVPSLTELL